MQDYCAVIRVHEDERRLFIVTKTKFMRQLNTPIISTTLFLLVLYSGWVVASDGGIVGPALSRMGGIRTPNDLLESVVFPSATIEHGFEPRSIATASGNVYTGILGRQSSDAIFLRAAERAEIRIPRAEIESMAASGVSIMPQGLDKTLTPAELRDLFDFLSSLK